MSIRAAKEAACMARRQNKRGHQVAKTVLRLPDLEQSKNAVLNSLAAPSPPKLTWGELARLDIRGQGVFRQLGFRAPQLQSGAHPGDSSLRFWPACNWAAWHDQQDQARSRCLKSGDQSSGAIHKSVSSPHRRNTRRPTLNIPATYNNLIAYNLISVAVWVCGRIDLEK